MARKLEIICDMDAILVDLFGPWLGWYNEVYQDDLNLERITAWNIQDFVKPECGRKIMDFFHPEKEHTVAPMLYRNLPPLPGAVEGFKELYDAGHDIVICSAVSGSTAGEKYLWCAQHLPFVHHHDIFLGNKKYRLTGDVFIDDGPHNVLAHRKRWGQQVHCMTIAYPHNADVYDHYDVYASGHKDTRKAWEEIVMEVDHLAHQEGP